MFIPVTVPLENAVRAFADYCAKSSTPEDIFDFDGQIVSATLKYCPLLTYYAEYRYTALVSITTENQVHSSSSLGHDTSAYRNNQKNCDRGFIASLYEDFSDTRYTDTTVTQKHMDRCSGKDCFLVFGSAGSDSSVEEALWPSENMDSSCIIHDKLDYQIQSVPLYARAIDICLASVDIDNAQVPEAKMDYAIRQDIQNNLRNRYSNYPFEIVNYDFEIDDDTRNLNLLCFPYYEFSFTYLSAPYTVRVAAHKQAEGSTGLFGSEKNVVAGNLPVFEKMPGGIFSKISARRSRSVGKKNGKEQFLNVTSKSIVLTV